MAVVLLGAPLVILYWGLGLWGFALVTSYIYAMWGLGGVFLGFFLLPGTYAIIPLWAGFADGYWLPALVCYSPVVVRLFAGFAISVAEG